MNKSFRLRALNGLIAFWYCNKPIFGYFLAFSIGFNLATLFKGALPQVAGMIILVLVGLEVATRDVIKHQPSAIFHDSDRELKKEIYVLWLKEEPMWSTSAGVIVSMVIFFVVLAVMLFVRANLQAILGIAL